MAAAAQMPGDDVANQKGGVGKTTSAVNLAAALSMHGQRVLVVDLDPQGNASTALATEHRAGVPSIYQVLVEDSPLASIVKPVPEMPGLFCAPATLDLAGAEIELVPMVGRETRLKRALRPFESMEFDYILIDCPPSLGLLTVNAMTAAQEVLIPIQCEYYALEGVTQLLQNVELVRVHLNQSLTVSTVLLTMYDGRTRLGLPGGRRGPVAFRRHRARRGHPAERTRLRSAELWSVRHDVRPGSSGAMAYMEAAREMAYRGATVAEA